jgi:flavin reductase (DIM6/NTAB) family NADH-FMN oxidoreductase RutF
MDEAQRKASGEAIGKIVSGVSVLTAAAEGKSTGVLVSWVQQVSFEPPMVMVAVKKGRSIEALINAGGGFALCVLAEDDNDLMRHFSRGYEADENAFEGLEVDVRDGGSPILTEAMACMECKLAGTCEAGDHNLYLGEVTGGSVLDAGRRPMIHIRKTGLSY